MTKLKSLIWFVPPAAAALWLIPFHLFCWRAHGHLGRWPVSIGDQQEVAAAFPVLHSIVALGLSLVFYAPLAWLGLTAVGIFLRAVSWRTLVAAFACWLPYGFVLCADPQGLFWWFID